MAATTTVSARLDPTLKEQAAQILQKSQVSDSELIRGVYEYVVRIGEVPAFVTIVQRERRPRAAKKFTDVEEWFADNPFLQFDFSDVTEEEWEEGYREAMEEKYGDPTA